MFYSFAMFNSHHNIIYIKITMFKLSKKHSNDESFTFRLKTVQECKKSQNLYRKVLYENLYLFAIFYRNDKNKVPFCSQ